MTNDKLKSLSARTILHHFKSPRVVGTTDDPTDSLEHHKKIGAQPTGIKSGSTFGGLTRY